MYCVISFLLKGAVTVPKCIPDGHTNMKHRMIFKKFFWHPNISWRLPKLLLMQEKHNWWSYDGLGCHDEWSDGLTHFLRCFYSHFWTWGQCEDYTTIIPKFENFLIRVSICGQIKDSVRSAPRSSPSLKMSLCVCPSAVKLRTAWGLHNDHSASCLN